jgi:FdhD protein
MNLPEERIKFHLYSSGRLKSKDINVIVEKEILLTVNGEIWLSFMCTPIDLEALAVGFLFNEGIIHSAEDIASVNVCSSGEIIDIWLNFSVEQPKLWGRTSGCTGGVTSQLNSEKKVTNEILYNTNGLTIDGRQVVALISQLFQSQDLYKNVGGVHTSALSDGFEIYVVAEDIGRHNTLDKIAGRCLFDEINLPKRVLITTGRVSSEMVQKSAKIGASIIISRTSPSSLSIKIAEEAGITLIGYARGKRFSTYSHPKRVVVAPV